MLKTEDVKELLKDQILCGIVKDVGYNCENGSKYVEIRNVIFEADKPSIFNVYRDKERMDPQWYVTYYEPRINPQFDKCIQYLIENPNTRRAILALNEEDEIFHPEGYVCTVFIHFFLDKIADNEYATEYIVHLRSNDAIDYPTDYKWNNKIYDRIINEVTKRTGWKLYKKNIIWNVDSLHVYSQFFDYIINN